MSTNPSIGAAIIVKNGETSIARALSSLAGITKQIVVVDTGSTDQTPQICSRFGAELHFWQWTDNFSEARNYAIERMRTDWIIQLDADEELNTDSFATIFPLITNSNIGGIQTQIWNVLDGGIESEHHYTRLFRRHPKLRYEGSIHEQIAGSIRTAGFDIADSSAVIRHFGYAENSPEKIERNITLLRKELSSNPNDIWLKYHLGLTEFAAKNHSIAESLLVSIIHSSELSTEQNETVRLRLGQIELAANKSAKARTFLDFSSKDIHREGLRLFVCGAAWAIEKEFEKAIDCFSQESVAQSQLVNQSELQSFIDGISTFLIRR